MIYQFDGDSPVCKVIYIPLVNVYIIMENHNFEWDNSRHFDGTVAIFQFAMY